MKKIFKNQLFVMILLIIGISYSGCKNNSVPQPEIKNIILLIGDGMGDAILFAANTVSDQPLNVTQFPYSGFSITYSASNYVTDSGAGGTAIACGVKAINYMIGMNPDSTIAPSIIDVLHQHGKAAGVVSTSTVTHATPASFVAHNENRNNYEAIAADYLKGTIDVFIGGGEDHFRNRKDGKDLTVNLKEQGFDVVYTLDELNASSSQKIAGLLAKEHMPTMLEGRDGALPAMTKKAIETLNKDEDGFFLMVEGSQIDFAAHANDADYTISETIDFDKAVGVALEFAKTDNNTLVIVTADHETGGVVIVGGNTKEHTVDIKFAIPDHSAAMVPIFSYGPGAEQFSGINQNTFFFDRFLKLLKIEE